MSSRTWLVGMLVAVAVISCSTGGGETDGTPVLTKAEVIARVDALCEGGQGRIEGLKEPKTLRQSAQFLAEILPVVSHNLTRIRRVGPIPAQDRDFYLEWLEARNAIVQITREMIDAAEAEDEVEFRKLAAEQARLDERADTAARAYGFKVCGQTS